MIDLKRKFRDLQAVVTILAVVLMMPPVILIFNGAGIFNQIPVVVAFIFGAWFLLIGITWWLARNSDAEEKVDPHPAPPTPPLNKAS